MGLIADDDAPRLRRRASGLKILDLLEEGRGGDDEPVADDARLPGMQDPRGDEMEDDLAAVDIYGVPGVVAALVAGDDVEGGGQEVDDLALAFVSPLRSEDEQVGHETPSFVCGRPRGTTMAPEAGGTGILTNPRGRDKVKS